VLAAASPVSAETTTNELGIAAIQGAGDTSPRLSQTVVTHGVVTADFQPPEQLGGFFMQDPQGDGDPASSEGIFVSAAPGLLDVSVGDSLRVTGTVAEIAGLTTLQASAIVQLPRAALPAATIVTLPIAQRNELERYEGMLIALGELTVSEAQGFEQLGQLILAGPDARGQPGRLWQPTQLWNPGSAEARSLDDENMRRLLVLDDARNPSPDASHDLPRVGKDPVRVGDRVLGLIGVLDQGATASALPLYRLQPTAAVEIRAANPRPRAPRVQGLTIASLNLRGHPSALGWGGASTPAASARQRQKLVRSLLDLDAAIYALVEVENTTGPRAALSELVGALNQATTHGGFAAIDTGRLGSAETKVAVLYRADRVAPVGDWVVLDDRVDPRAISTRNRPALAQTFRDLVNGEELTAVVNQWQAKSAACSVGRPGTHEVADGDAGDGQGECNRTRASMAQALIAWLERQPTGSRDPDVLILGALNAYAQEDPVRALEERGFVNLIERQLGASAYTHIADARSGYLDHALASPSLAAKLNRVAIWHSNADEPTQLAAAEPEDAYRAAEHDPLVVAFTLKDSPPAPIVPVADGPSGWIMLFGSTLLVLWAAGAASRRRRPAADLGAPREEIAGP
jgi:predicted extracellular nuclease